MQHPGPALILRQTQYEGLALGLLLIPTLLTLGLPKDEVARSPASLEISVRAATIA
jgi:hypothetical protein